MTREKLPKTGQPLIVMHFGIYNKKFSTHGYVRAHLLRNNDNGLAAQYDPVVLTTARVNVKLFTHFTYIPKMYKVKFASKHSDW